MNFTRSISIPKFLKIGNFRELQDSLVDLFEKENLVFKRALIITGTSNTRVFADVIAKDFHDKGYDAWIKCIRNNTMQQVEAIVKCAGKCSPDILIGIGGGKVIDVAKAAATSTSVPFLSVPTCLSNDGICSPVSVIKNSKKIKSIGVAMPMGIVIDLDVIRKSPLGHIRSGAGDLISNLSACNDWILAHEKNNEKIDLFSEAIAKHAAGSILKHRSIKARDAEFLRTLSEGLILSGIAMALAGSSRPASGAEHLISHAIDDILQAPSSHGEQVGVASVYTETLRGNRKIARNTRELLKAIGAAMRPEDFGISKKDFLKAVMHAPKTRQGRFTILDVINNRKELEKAYDEAFS
jgi:glycerol-1-phosphate dehydrogenase [NAD(P)+]